MLWEMYFVSSSATSPGTFSLGDRLSDATMLVVIIPCVCLVCDRMSEERMESSSIQ